jgi:hypothetical protein
MIALARVARVARVARSAFTAPIPPGFLAKPGST